MKKALMSLIILFCVSNIITARELSNAFEFRYYQNNPAANGETDFKGDTAVFDTEQRLQFLDKYAQYATQFFHDPHLNTQAVTDSQVEDFLKQLKPQPQPRVRQRLLQGPWKWRGYSKSSFDRQTRRIAALNQTPGLQVQNDTLLFTNDNTFLNYPIEPQKWRFSLQWQVKLPHQQSSAVFTLLNNQTPVITVEFDANSQIFCSAKEEKISLGSYTPDQWYHIKLEVDLSEDRFNLYLNDRLAADFVELKRPVPTAPINAFTVTGCQGVALDDIWCVGHERTADEEAPYTIETFIDDTFDTPLPIDGWNRLPYDDSTWAADLLPVVHGGQRYAGQDLYLRKTVRLENFARAVLKIETLDPAGEVWVNGEVAAVIRNRHPVSVDITEYLHPNDINLIALRVKHFVMKNPMHHSPADQHIGWFAGRAHLDLTPKHYIDDVFVTTQSIDDPAQLKVRATIVNENGEPVTGQLAFRLFPWYPNESAKPSVSVNVPYRVRAWNRQTIETTLSVPQPLLWSYSQPQLYKLEAVLEDRRFQEVDDYPLTTGIRTVSQLNSQFHVNHQPEMLNGAQIMGFRMPLEKIATWNRCPPASWLAKELMMIKNMNGNMMRIHVHAWYLPARGVNDPRIAEIADQLGVMLIWSTTSWIRAGHCWGIDFEGFPKYMRQVYNHPSIVMWEAGNHPNRFKDYDVEESNAFVKKTYDTIYPVDQSRLISFTSYIKHLHFGNDLGTVDYQGNPMTPAPAWTAPMVTRGNQDTITGYGKEWSTLRHWPPEFQQSFLQSPYRAYFNFEHEESIAQPNWSLVKGKPWYKVQSYEWDYDIGSIGRRLTADEWLRSQAWQGFSAYEAMKKQRILDYDGFSWCCLHGGPNTGTYKKPIIDALGYAKIAFYTNKMVFQRVLAGSNNVDVVYGPDDAIDPVVLNLDDQKCVQVDIMVKDLTGNIVDSKTYSNVHLPAGRNVTTLERFQPNFPAQGYYAVEYRVTQ